MSPTAAMNVARDDHVDAGDGHQPLDLGPAQGVGGDQLVDLRDLGVEEVDLAQAGVDGLALVDCQLLLSQPASTLDPEEVRCRRAVLQAAQCCTRAGGFTSPSAEASRHWPTSSPRATHASPRACVPRRSFRGAPTPGWYWPPAAERGRLARSSRRS